MLLFVSVINFVNLFIFILSNSKLIQHFKIRVGISKVKLTANKTIYTQKCLFFLLLHLCLLINLFKYLIMKFISNEQNSIKTKENITDRKLFVFVIILNRIHFQCLTDHI
jgi:hypothetical protein